MDGRPNHRNSAAFSSLSGVVWRGPFMFLHCFFFFFAIASLFSSSMLLFFLQVTAKREKIGICFLFQIGGERF